MTMPWMKNPAPYVGSVERDRLETGFVDRTSMSSVLTALEEIAIEKADHVGSNWQDEQLAKAWMRVARAIEKAADKVRGEGL